MKERNKICINNYILVRLYQYLTKCIIVKKNVPDIDNTEIEDILYAPEIKYNFLPMQKSNKHLSVKEHVTMVYLS